MRVKNIVDLFIINPPYSISCIWYGTQNGQNAMEVSLSKEHTKCNEFKLFCFSKVQ